MAATKLPMFLTKKQLKEHVVDWSDDTLYRRIKEGFPAIKDHGNYVFPTQECIDYLKRRTVRTND